MGPFLLVTRVFLAVVFAAAGVAKAADMAGTRNTVTEFGLPPRLVAPLGVALPVAELATAALLLPAATAWWGALTALGLLLAFMVAIAGNLARGRRPDCHCFGKLRSEPIG